MNTPIINPMWIWAIHTLTSIDFWIGLITKVLIIATIHGIVVFAIWSFLEIEYWTDADDKAFKTGCNIIKKTLIWLGILLIVESAIPSEKTMYTMMATNYVTEENINITGETVTDAIDYIFEKVDMLLEDNE